MKVYYNSSLWSRDKGIPGLPERVNWEFEYGGVERCIPVIYRFQKGIVFDIITFLDCEKLREFFEKYEAIERALTPLERRCAEQEHPFEHVPVSKIYINGERAESGFSSSSSVSMPWVREKDVLAPVRKTYCSILKDTDCFACQRFCVPYPETDSKIRKLLRFLHFDGVNCIKLCTHPMVWFSPLDIRFEMSSEDHEKAISFRHPITGIMHTLYFQSSEPVEIPLDPGKNRSFYAVQSMYEIEPALPEGDTLQFKSGIQYTEPPVDKSSPAAVSSIGIIGGACGPTAIFVSSKGRENSVPRGVHGLPLNICFSVPGFKKADAWQFIIEGINIKKYDSMEYGFTKHNIAKP